MDELSNVAGELPMPSEDELRAIQQQQRKAAEMMQATMQAASEKLPQLLAENSDLTRLSYTILLGYRLIHWAFAEAGCIKDMTPAMLEILAGAQEMKAREVFSFSELIKDLQKNQMPWLEGQRREALAKKTMRERRIKKLTEQLRRKDIPLPFHSMTALFDEKGFQHNGILLIYGPKAALELVLRRCALDYQKTGGIVALLSGVDGDEGDTRISKFTIPASRWRDMGYVYNDVLDVLSPVTKAGFQKPVGLLVVEGLDNACLHSQLQEGRPHRLLRTLSYLQSYHRERGMAVIVGIETDGYPQGIDMEQLYLPQMLMTPHVRVAIQESKLVEGSTNIVVGNDVVPMSKLRAEVEGEPSE